MRRGVPPVFFAALLLCAAGCSSRSDPPRPDPPVDAQPPTTKPTPATKPAPPPPNAPVDDAERALRLPAETALYAARGPQTDVAVPAHDLACVRAHGAPTLERLAPLEETARAQSIALGTLRVLRLRGADTLDACRAVARDAPLLAPLFRVREPAARWVVRTRGPDTPAVAIAALTGTPVSAPRVLVVDGAMPSVAILTEVR